jgi:probable rRNA maturation factor
MELLIQNQQDKVVLPAKLKNQLRQVIEHVLVLEQLSSLGEVSVLLVDDQRIQALNANYRGIDEATDVLSFPQLEPEEIQTAEGLPLGDVVISMEKAAAQAKEYGHSLTRETAYLLVHGLYHLLGYKHETTAQKNIMRGKEENVLGFLGLVRDL